MTLKKPVLFLHGENMVTLDMAKGWQKSVLLRYHGKE